MEKVDSLAFGPPFAASHTTNTPEPVPPRMYMLLSSPCGLHCMQVFAVSSLVNGIGSHGVLRSWLMRPTKWTGGVTAS